ncbi:OmpW/AlkL family protein [Pararobbsia silviterrae]|uniref:OmpW family protein n=1 Tax=Pararobbsia silviterrae TaxID=1792498 RepID=A0A494XA68_9BURK|nr:OmpW family outer membrane protein [Pararobbsia silviterrae]RKP47697.1 OmpW family protein [Pararobbsia silviterrae]
MKLASNKIRSLLAALAVPAFALLASPAAHAAQGDVLVRLRGIVVDPDVSSNDTLSSIHSDVSTSAVPELDFTYMFTDAIGAELILATSRHDLTSDLGNLGKVSVLPPTLTLQYHFNDAGRIRPYVGAGINYTLFYHNSLSVAGQGVDITNHSFGPALQAGVDYAISDKWFVNLDVKKIWIHTDASLGDTDLGRLRIDPWIVGFGIGRKF